jgi:hypothetical protein
MGKTTKKPWGTPDGIENSLGRYGGDDRDDGVGAKPDAA